MYGFHNFYDGPYMMGGWFGGLSILSTVVFWVALASAGVFIVRWLRSGGRTGGYESALEILEKRYAKGEIDKKEFEEKKKDLRKAQ